MEEYLDEVVAALRGLRQVDLTGYRCCLLAKHVADRIVASGCASPEAYLEYLRSHTAECDTLLNAVAINVSRFFRNPIVFEYLAQSVFPVLMEEKRKVNRRELRVWCAGCATGEEAYSVAILLKEALAGEDSKWASFLFATDVSVPALEEAATGMYHRDRLENVKLGLFNKYFVSAGAKFQVRPAIREMVAFSVDDLTSEKTTAPKESVFGGFDLVLCRNVLIYYSRPLQARVLRKLQDALLPGGYLVLGEAESLLLERPHKLQTLDARNRIYRKTGA